MRQSERHNRSRINPINWSLTAILLAACGGGGGGKSSPKTTFTNPQSSTASAPNTAPENLLFVQGTNGVYSGSVGENAVTFTAEQIASTTNSSQVNSLEPCIENVRFLSPQRAIVTLSLPIDNSRRSVEIEYFIEGRDASLIEIVSIDADGRTVLKFTSSPDYERPRDFDGDNVYEASITARYGTVVNSEQYLLRVTDKQDGQTHVASEFVVAPDHVRDGEVIKITIKTGQTEVFVFNSDALSFLSGTVLEGFDADKSELRRAFYDDNKYRTILEFKNAPDIDAPTDRGGNNVYNVELANAAETAFGNLSFEVTVLEVARVNALRG